MNRHFDKAGIRVYFCRNCGYAGKLPAEIKKLAVLEDIAMEAVPCSGRIDPRYIMKAFEGGSKAVCVLACPTGECKMLEGNLRAFRRVRLASQMLAEAGLDADAVRIYVPGSVDEDTIKKAVEVIAGVTPSTQRDEVLV